MPEPQTLNLSVFAELSARMSAGGKKSDVLAEAQVDPERWEASQQFWLKKMADEAARDRFALTQKYSGLYQAALARVTEQATQAQKAVKRRAVVEASKVVVYAAPAVPARPPPVEAPADGGVSSTRAPGPVPSERPPASVQPPSVASVPPAASVRPAAMAHVARLTVEQLAAMRAELASSPEGEHPAVRQRFGLDDATWALEEAHWQRKLAVDKDLFGQYLKRFQYCRALLQR